MAVADVLDRARAAFLEQSWETAYTGFCTADAQIPLSASDLDLYARTAYLVGKDEHCVRVLERAYHQRLEHGQREQAAQSAFWLGFNLMNRGETARAGGWLARAGQLVDAEDRSSATQGLLLVPKALHLLMSGDADASLELFEQALAIGRRTGDAEVEALGGLGVGQARIALGAPEAGLAQLDEVMVAVTAGEVSPIVSGLVYCAVIVACHETYEIRRAAEWTKALSRWCAAQPDLVPFRGQCLVHRAEILQLNGAWDDAMEQVQLARRRFSDPPGQPAIGMALYEQAELHRLRGELAAAEDAFGQANQCGHETQPGLALLRVAQGRLEAAQAGVRRALEETPAHNRPRLLAASVEIALTVGETSAARRCADELAELVGGHETAVLAAMSAQAGGSVLLAEGRPRDALDQLRRAWALWRDLDAPYLAARVRELQARACRELGDHDAADMELRAAVDVFRELGAAPDVARLAGAGTVAASAGRDGLTAREVQVLREVASGKTNREVAENLFLSEKTVARHLSNIYTKLDISTRSAATAYAYEHDLV